MPKTSQTEDDDNNPYRHKSHPDRATLADYRDDKLSAQKKSQVQSHVSNCMPCRNEFLEMCGTL